MLSDTPLVRIECPTCGWPTHTDRPIACSQCGTSLEFQGRIAETVEERGRKAWAALHSVENPTPQWYAEWLLTIPTFGCKCQSEWSKITLRNPPDFDNFAQWAIDRHNDVNKKLGKPIWHPPKDSE